jgi:hypothetical protein
MTLFDVKYICPNCLCEIKDLAGERLPVNGDIAICAQCGHPVTWKGNKLILMEVDDILQLDWATRIKIAASQQVLANNFNREVNN